MEIDLTSRLAIVYWTIRIDVMLMLIYIVILILDRKREKKMKAAKEVREISKKLYDKAIETKTSLVLCMGPCGDMPPLITGFGSPDEMLLLITRQIDYICERTGMPMEEALDTLNYGAKMLMKEGILLSDWSANDRRKKS